MSANLTKQKELLQKAFNDDYHRKVSSPFGVMAPPRTKPHDGTDYGVDEGENIYPIYDDVEITKIVNNVNANYKSTTGTEKDFGNYVIYYIPKWDISILYAHLKSILASLGKINYKVIGQVGNTGLSTGAHLHLGVAKGRHTTLASIRKHALDFEELVISIEKTEVKPEAGKATIKAGAVYRSQSAKYDGKVVPATYVGKSMAYELDKVGGVDWVYFPEIQSYVDAKNVNFEKDDVKPTPIPTPKPSNVGKVAQLRGTSKKPINLYVSSTIKNPAAKGETGSKNLKILDEANGRLLVESSRYNPTKVWVNSKDVKVV